MDVESFHCPDAPDITCCGSLCGDSLGLSAKWPKVKLAEISKIYSGFAFKSQDLGKYGIPVIKIGNIQNKRVRPECTDHLPEELCVEKLSRYFLQKGDTLIAMTGAGSVGKVGKMSSVNGRFLVNQRVAIVRPDDFVCDSAFVYFVLSQDFYETKLYALGLGAGQPNVSAKEIGDLVIPLPPLQVQQRIAGILSAYDELIENSQRRIRILEEMSRSLYREWFVHFRFPGHENHPLVPSSLGDIPQGWEVKRLGELVTIRKGRNITKKNITNGSIPVVAGGIGLAYYHNTSNTKNPVVTVSASGANAGYVNLYYEDIWASDCSIIDMNLTPYVYYFYLLLFLRQNEVTRLQRGSAQPHVYPKDIMDLGTCKAPNCLLKIFLKKLILFSI